MKELLLDLAGVAGGHALARRLTRSSLRILCYHGLWTLPEPVFGETLFMAVDQFEDRMRRLAASPYPVLDLTEAVDLLDKNRLPAGATVITIDDGWRSTHTHMLPILEELGLRSTLYMSTWYMDHRAPVLNVALAFLIDRSRVATLDLSGVAPDLDGEIRLDNHPSRSHLAQTIFQAIDALPTLDERLSAYANIALRAGFAPPEIDGQFFYMTPMEAADASRRGMRVELHTHRHRDVTDNLPTLEAEVKENRASLQRAGAGQDFVHFCYPGGYYTPAAEPLLARSGIRSATLASRGVNPPGTHPFRLRRFLDGPRITQPVFDAYMAGLFQMFDRTRPM